MGERLFGTSSGRSVASFDTVADPEDAGGDIAIHTPTAGAVINGGDFTVPAALGDKTVHRFSDFLLPDVGTGDVPRGRPARVAFATQRFAPHRPRR